MSLVTRIVAVIDAIRDKINIMTPRLLPPGGGAGQVLTKSSAADYASAWSGPQAATAAVVTVPYPPRYEWEQAISDTSLTGSETLQVWLAPTTSSDENEPEMLDIVALTAQASAGVVTIRLTFSEVTSGPIRLLYKA